MTRVLVLALLSTLLTSGCMAVASGAFGAAIVSSFAMCEAKNVLPWRSECVTDFTTFDCVCAEDSQ